MPARDVEAVGMLMARGVDGFDGFVVGGFDGGGRGGAVFLLAVGAALKLHDTGA